jgi:MFS family permease
MSPGTALASVSTIGFLGFLIGPPVIGFIAQAVSLRWSFTLIAILGFGTAVLARKLKSPSKPESGENAASDEDNAGNQSKNSQSGFVAWPETLYATSANIDQQVIHGRTRGGGYVAYPKMG